MCGPRGKRRNKVGSVERVTWGAPSLWINLFPVYWGRVSGFFKENGIDLKVKYLHGGPELAEAVRKGSIRIGNMGVPPFLKAFSEGLPAKIIGSTAIQRLDSYLVSQREIERIADLRGKRVGVLSVGSCDSYFLRRIMEKDGMSSDVDTKVVPLKESYGKLSEILSGRVDATFMVEPHVTLGESQGMLKVLAHVADYFPKYQWGILFAREDLLTENRGMVNRVLDAYRRSAKSIKEGPEETTAYGSRLFRMKKAVFRKALDRSLPNWEGEGKLDREGLRNAIRIQREMGAIPRDIDVEELVDR